MKIYFYCFILCLVSVVSVFGQKTNLTLTSTDSVLQTAFARAKEMALRYKGKPGDEVGPWYESALPPRSAFCMRDVSHQSIAAGILGMNRENKNMMDHFVRNISDNKDWCSYWEINKSGKPAPEDYQDDKAFWYNLNANFDVLSACWKLYLWTGDKTYINGPEYANFHQKTTEEFIDRWVLQVDSLLTRNSHPNEPANYDRKDLFHEYRGLASYSEGVPHVKMGVDLIAAIYRGMLSYASMLRVNHQLKKAEYWEQKALAYQQHIDSKWWDTEAGLYNTHFTDDGTFGKGEGETFLLWFDALQDPVRTKKTIAHLLEGDWNMENLSYLPYQLYRFGYSKEAYQYLVHLTNPATKRREYPEVSYGVIHAIVQGLMGIDADASVKTVSTTFRGNDEATVEVSDVSVLNGSMRVRHDGHRRTYVKNTGPATFKWKARFAGAHPTLRVGKKMIRAIQEEDRFGKTFSYLILSIKPGENKAVSIR